MIKNIISILALLILSSWGVAYGQAYRFQVSYKGKTLKNNQIVEIRDYTATDGEITMKFEPEVKNIDSQAYGMFLEKNVIDTQDNASNDMCWDQCMESDYMTAECIEVKPGIPEKEKQPYARFFPNYYGDAIIGTSIIKYTFMTFDPEDKMLTVEVHYIYDGPAVSTKEGSLLSLSGHWTKADLETLDLSDVSLTGLDMTGIYIPENAPTLSPANPNLLIYVGEGVNVPSTWKNVVKGTSAESIELKDGHTFKSMKEFTTKAISYSRNFAASEWSTISIPFSVTSLPEKIQIEQFTEALTNGIRFESVDLIEPNTPYILSAEENGEITFTGTEATIPVSTNGSVVLGNYTFQGCSELVANDQTVSRFALNATGTEFRKETGKDIPAFRGHMQTTNTDASIISVTHGKENSINQDRSDAPIINVVDGLLYISVKEAQSLSIYEVSGICVKKTNLISGINKIPGLAKGVYLISGKKVIL